MNYRIQWILALGMATLATPALAQNPYDPPTSVRPPPNVMLLMDATGTTRINGSTCRGSCHVEGPTPGACGGWGGEWDCNIYGAGETRLQLARRVLTGGWGWNTGHVNVPNGPADAQLRVMPLVGPVQVHHVRWKCTVYYTRITRPGWPIPQHHVDESEEVIYIDHTHLHMVGNVDEAASPAPPPGMPM